MTYTLWIDSAGPMSDQEEVKRAIDSLLNEAAMEAAFTLGQPLPVDDTREIRDLMSMAAPAVRRKS